MHKDRVYNLALNYLQNAEDAEEVTQDVFVAVFRSMEQFRHEAEISTWIYRITINKSLDHIKAKKRKKRWGVLATLFYGDENRTMETPDFNHPGVQLEQKQALEKIFKYINELPENQRTALLLSKTEQKSQAEVAAIMNISPKAAESLIQRARKNLAEKLNRNE